MSARKIGANASSKGQFMKTPSADVRAAAAKLFSLRAKALHCLRDVLDRNRSTLRRRAEHVLPRHRAATEDLRSALAGLPLYGVGGLCGHGPNVIGPRGGRKIGMRARTRLAALLGRRRGDARVGCGAGLVRAKARRHESD